MANDPFLAQQNQLFAAAHAADAAQLQQGVQQAFIDYGGIPDFAGLNTAGSPWMNFLTPNIQQLAQQNTAAGTSQLARLLKATADNQRVAKQQMAARGILSSGETLHQFTEEGLRFKQAQYDTSKQLLDYLSGAYAALASRDQERTFAQLNARQEAALRQQELQFRQQQQAQEYQLAQQQLAASQSAASGGGGEPFDLQGFLDSILGGGGGEAPGAAPMPSAGEIAAAKAVAKKAARHRSQQEKDTLAAFNASYGPVGQY